MEGTVVGSIIVAGIAAVSAFASQRAAARAAVINNDTTARVDMEREAYMRARTFDVDTITRQNGIIEEQRLEIKRLKNKVEELLVRVFNLEHPHP